MRACIELPRDYGWGPVRLLRGRIEDDGYQVTEIRVFVADPARRHRRRPPGPGDGARGSRGGRPAAAVPQRPYDVLPVLPALAPLLPGGGLAKGSVLAVEQPGALCLALIAGPSQAGMWCGVAGLPGLGIVAAAEAGAEPDRMMLVPEPGPRWAEVVATMLDACEVVLLRPAGRAPARARRRVETTARRSGAALIVAGTWDGAPVRLHVARQQWDGIGDGYGRLRARRAEVVAEGRASLVRPRCVWLWLPGPDGKITAAAGPAGSRARGASEEDGQRITDADTARTPGGRRAA